MTQHHIDHEPRDPLDFEPVPHGAKRSDGWTPTRQREFIATLARIGSVRGAAKAVGLQPCGAYKLRNKPGGRSFALAWDAAVFRGTQAIRDVMVDHALNGIPDPVFHGGKQVGERRRFNVRGQQWLVEKGGHAMELQRQRELHEDPRVVRKRIMDLCGKFYQAACNDLQARLNTDEKRAAFDLLWNSTPFYPLLGSERVCMSALADAQVAGGMIGAAHGPKRKPGEPEDEYGIYWPPKP